METTEAQPDGDDQRVPEVTEDANELNTADNSSGSTSVAVADHPRLEAESNDEEGDEEAADEGDDDGRQDEDPNSKAIRPQKKSMWRKQIEQKIDEATPKLFDALAKFETGVETAVDRATETWDKLSNNASSSSPVTADSIFELFWIFVGLVLCFWGRHLSTSVSFFAAFRQGGSDRLAAKIQSVKEQLAAFREATRLDALVDEDNDGIPDVLQVTRQELTKRKIRVIMKVVKPSVFESALTTLWSALFTAAATTKLHQAKKVSLGITLGDHLGRLVERYILPVIKKRSSKVGKKWALTVMHYVCKFIGIVLAFQMGTALSLVATAVKGATLVVDGIKGYLRERGWVKWSQSLNFWDDLVISVLIILGACTQAFLLGDPPVFVRLLVFPVFLCEFLLETFVGSV